MHPKSANGLASFFGRVSRGAPYLFFSFPLIKAENKTTPNPEYKRGRSRTKTKKEKRGGGDTTTTANYY